MSKRMYIIPETDTAPLHLSACIMSGESGGTDPDYTDPNQGSVGGNLGAPRKKVF